MRSGPPWPPKAGHPGLNFYFAGAVADGPGGDPKAVNASAGQEGERLSKVNLEAGRYAPAACWSGMLLVRGDPPGGSENTVRQLI
jgi:hypothetical protein